MHIDYAQAKADVLPFVSDARALDVWAPISSSRSRKGWSACSDDVSSWGTYRRRCATRSMVRGRAGLAVVSGAKPTRVRTIRRYGVQLRRFGREYRLETSVAAYYRRYGVQQRRFGGLFGCETYAGAYYRLCGVQSRRFAGLLDDETCAGAYHRRYGVQMRRFRREYRPETSVAAYHRRYGVQRRRFGGPVGGESSAIAYLLRAESDASFVLSVKDRFMRFLAVYRNLPR